MLASAAPAEGKEPVYEYGEIENYFSTNPVEIGYKWRLLMAAMIAVGEPAGGVFADRNERISMSQFDTRCMQSADLQQLSRGNAYRSKRALRQTVVNNVVFGAAILFIAAVVCGVL